MAMRSIAVCIGDNCIDNYLPPIDRKFIGGNALNVAVHLQQGGIPTAYVGFVGDDMEGKIILDGLKSKGIDVSHVQVLTGRTAQSYIRLSSEGDREFVHEDLGEKESFSIDELTLRFILRHRLVHNTWLGGSESYLPQLKETSDLVVSFDYGERCPPEFIEETISYVDIAFFSLPEFRAEEASKLAHHMRTRGPRLVVVTMGKKGSLAYDGEHEYLQHAFPVQVVDTLGAGDAYIGTFLASWLKGESIPEGMERAAKVAAHTCTHLGAWE